MKRLFFLLSAGMACLAFAAANVHAAAVANDDITESGPVAADSVAIDEDTETDAGILYYRNIGKPFPLDNIAEDADACNFKKIKADAEEVLRHAPDSFHAKIYLSYACRMLGKGDKALKVIFPLWVQYPFDNNVRYELSEIAKSAPESVISALKEKTGENRDDPAFDEEICYSANELTANAYVAMGRKAYAVDNCFPRMIHIAENLRDNFDYGDALYSSLMYLSTLYLHLGHPEKALEVLDRMESSGVAEEYELLGQRSIAFRNMGRYDKALDLLKKQCEALEGYPGPVENLCTELTIEDKYDQAVDAADNFLDTYGEGFKDEQGRYPDNVVRIIFRRAIANMLAGKKDDALGDFNSVINEYPKNSTYWHALAFSGRMNEVEKDFAAKPQLFDAITKASIYGASMLCPTIDKDTAEKYGKKALKHLAEAYRLQQASPQNLKNDIVLRHLTKLSGYKNAEKKFNPTK